MKILITSASKPAAISLARALASENHEVYGADEEPIWGTAPARWSRAYSRFYRLKPNCTIARLSDIDLVIPFGGGAECAQIEAIAREGGATIFSHPLFDDDFEFQDFIRRHVTNKFDSVIKLPAAFRIHSTRCIAEILAHYPITTFALQPTTCQDPDDTDEDDEITLVDISSPTYAGCTSNTTQKSLILSCLTLDEHMIDAIKDLNIVERNPYRLIEVIEGGTSYSSHAIITGGMIRALLVTTTSPAPSSRAHCCPTSFPGATSDSDFTVLPHTDPLFDVLSTFTTRFITTRKAHNSFNGIFEEPLEDISMHLTLTFRVKEEIRYGELVRRITVLSCEDTPHTSLMLLYTFPSKSLRRYLVRAYTSAAANAGHNANATTMKPTEPATLPDVEFRRGVYSLLVVLMGLVAALRGFVPWKRSAWDELFKALLCVLVLLMCFKEEIWAGEDPGPAVCTWVVGPAVDWVQRVSRRNQAQGWVVWAYKNVWPYWMGKSTSLSGGPLKKSRFKIC